MFAGFTSVQKTITVYQAMNFAEKRRNRSSRTVGMQASRQLIVVVVTVN
jgi:hypothetical protein